MGTNWVNTSTMMGHVMAVMGHVIDKMRSVMAVTESSP